METDFISNPRAFAAANEEARQDFLRSLTLERAAEILEELLELPPLLTESGRAMGLPPPPPNPLPGPTLAILLEGSPSEHSSGSIACPPSPKPSEK